MRTNLNHICAIPISDRTQTNKANGEKFLHECTFHDAMKFTLQWEGGISKDPQDPGNAGGNATAYGVTQRAYNSYRKKQGYSLKNVTTITNKEVHDLYQIDYFSPLKPKNLSPRHAIALFDTAVNVGVPQAKRLFQKAIQIGDGDKFKTLSSFLDLRRAFYRKLAKREPYSRYLKGWLNRTNALERYLR